MVVQDGGVAAATSEAQNMEGYVSVVRVFRTAEAVS
jgi:hypothetical protein